MDLTEISREQALIDLDLANARIVELTCRIDQVARDVQARRAELSALQKKHDAAQAPRKTEPTVPAAPPAIGPKPGSGSPAGAAARPPAKRPAVSLWNFLMSAFFRRPKPRELMAHVDEICGRPVAGDGVRPRHAVTRIEFREFAISGWAFPRNFAGTMAAVELLLVDQNGRIVRASAATFRREDVAAHFGDVRALNSGFSIVIPMVDIAAGQYVVRLRGVTEDGTDAEHDVLELDVR